MSGAQALPAAWLAVLDTRDERVLPIALGCNRQHAAAMAERQFAGTPASAQAVYRQRIRFVALDADAASEMAEFFATPWENNT